MQYIIIQIHHAASTCILLSFICICFFAAKFEERDDAIPSIDALQYSARLVHPNISFSAEEIVILELYALKYFKWNVSRPGVAHFVDYYQHESMSCCSDHVNNTAEKKLMENHAQEFITGFMEPVIRGTYYIWQYCTFHIQFVYAVYTVFTVYAVTI